MGSTLLGGSLVTQRKVKSQRESARTIAQYCSVCKKTFDMPVVEEADSQEVIWLKCPGCSGYLPHMLNQDEIGDGDAGEGHETSPARDDLSIEDLYTENAREYSEVGRYEVGEVIYHRSWNDYGKVVAKETLPGNRKTIVVHFVNQGKIKLLEGVA
jgi:hypothetical protein